ncbi:aspartate-semialdehyde dehydrogenase [Ancylomarina longa]|uniref:Aspartate-semialdehyde dehydrogenase n=1 Tax=Ancylomarina longa TaxID=2487017 RepID=A0A434AF00_9BACT|nr:aspartate-semialdehyde dehydrogenase [Ancylomarina longa]RUT72949.1 aspartate-semialdehyde dehydrogenase [Ancylomarina longa]
MRIAIVGATGLVGQKILEVLEERNFPISELYPVASEKSVGKEIDFRGKKFKVIAIKDAINLKPQIAIFSAGGETSLKWAPEFANVGTTVVDNSSAWRMDESKKLIVPEINAAELTGNDKIIANPNCSTIQLVVALAPLHKRYKIKRLVISTYQSITGTGIKAVRQLEAERSGKEVEKAYPFEIDKNCIPHCDDFTENGYTKEEMKLVNEPRKILNDDSIKITATAVRVPVVGGHSESVNIEFEKDFDLKEVRKILEVTKGIIVQDDIKNNLYPMPKYSHEKDEVFVGRIRRDFSNPNTLQLWIVSDNLRKGAATNAVQIAEFLKLNQLI